MSKKGLKVTFEKGKCVISKKKETEAEGKMWNENNNLYHLETVEDNNYALVTQATASDWKTWYHRLGHLSYGIMKKEEAEDLNLKQYKATDKFCESCALGKATKQPHETITKKPKDENYIVIHSNLVGPVQTKSIGEKSIF